MAQHDSFIDEVTEEVRRDRLFGYIRRYFWIPLLAVILLVGGAAYLEWQKSTRQAEAERFGDAVRAAMETEDLSARAEALAGVEATGDERQRALLALLGSAVLSAEGEADKATARLEELSGDAALPAYWRDLVTLKAVISGASTIAPDDRIARLEPLAAAGSPYRLMAMEQIAIARIEKGETEAAIQTLRDIIDDNAVTQGLRSRAEQLIVVLGGASDAA